MTDTPPLGPWTYGLGAVLYDGRTDPPTFTGRPLYHVTKRLIDVETGARHVVIRDGMHRTRRHFQLKDAVDEFDPAGWQWPPSLKPAASLRGRYTIDESDRPTGGDV